MWPVLFFAALNEQRSFHPRGAPVVKNIGDIMTFDICPICDGTGERCFLSGAKCYECNGTGVWEDEEPEDNDLLDMNDESIQEADSESDLNRQAEDCRNGDQ